MDNVHRAGGDLFNLEIDDKTQGLPRVWRIYACAGQLSGRAKDAFKFVAPRDEEALASIVYGSEPSGARRRSWQRIAGMV